eukprot:133932-Chlamydomonas_euryale.AAC.1
MRFGCVSVAAGGVVAAPSLLVRRCCAGWLWHHQIRSSLAEVLRPTMCMKRMVGCYSHKLDSLLAWASSPGCVRRVGGCYDLLLRTGGGAKACVVRGRPVSVEGKAGRKDVWSV